MAAKITPLNLTSIYRYADEATKGDLQKTLFAYSLIKEGTIRVEYDMIRDAMLDITNRTSPYPSKYAVDELVKKGVLQLVYNTHKKLTVAIPFFRKSDGGKPVMVINITNFSRMDASGNITIQPNVLYAYLLTAAYCLDIEHHLPSITRDMYIIYARLFSNVVSSLSYMDMIKKEKIQFLASNFFFYHINGDNHFDNPYYNNLRYNGKDAIKYVDSKFPMYTDHSAYKDMQTFIENIVLTFPEMKKLTFKNFIDAWSRSLGASTLFASEYMPYFIYMLISTAVTSPTLSIHKVSMEAGDNLSKIYRSIESRVTDMLN